MDIEVPSSVAAPGGVQRFLSDDINVFILVKVTSGFAFLFRRHQSPLWRVVVNRKKLWSWSS